MLKNEVKLGSKLIFGKIVDFDSEEVEKMKEMSKSLKQMENNIKESIISKMK